MSSSTLLTAALRPLGALLNRGVARSTTAAALCRKLEGRSLQVVAGGVVQAWFTVTDGALQLHPGSIAEPSATLSGNPLNLAALAAGDAAEVIRSGRVSLSGDTEVCEAYQALFELVRPDPEEELAIYTGDAFAHAAGEAARGVFGWARQARRSLERSTGEYLSEEVRAVATAAEIELFCADVDRVSAGVDRLQARLALLQSQLIAGQDS